MQTLMHELGRPRVAAHARRVAGTRGVARAGTRAVALAVALALALAGAGACAGRDITATLAPPCEGVSPDERFRGNWEGTLAGRSLQLDLDRVCTGLNFQSFWSIEGVWRWGTASNGSVTLFAGTFHLKANALGVPFRGLTIAVQDRSGSADTVYGLATGELPLAASTGAWQTFTAEPVMIVRR